MTILEAAIETGFHYYTQFRIHQNNQLKENFLKTVELLAQFRENTRKDLFYPSNKSLFYDKNRDYRLKDPLVLISANILGRKCDFS